MQLDNTTIQLLESRFDKVLVVSVPRFTDRHKTVTEKLNGLRFDFFWGADKMHLDGEMLSRNYNEIKARKLQRQGKALNFGEIACALSHRMVYDAMIENGWEKVLILEDDVLPVYDKLDQLTAAMDELPADWELVYLGYLKHEVVTAALKRKQFFYRIISSIGLMKWTYKMVSNLLPKPFSAHLRKAGFHDCTHAYAITLEAAKKLRAAQSPVVYRADDLLSATIMKGKLKAFVTDPKFFDQEVFHNIASGSEIRN